MRINERLNNIEVIIYISFFILNVFLIKNMIINNGYYKNRLLELTNIMVYGDSSPRGRIYDRNNKLLVDNERLLQITYKKENNISKIDEINLAYEVSKYMDLDYSKLDIRNLKEFYLIKNKKEADSKITKEEYEKLDRRILNLNDIENLKISRITDSDLNIYEDKDKKCAYLYYLMNKGYSYNEKVIKDNATEKEYAYFIENVDSLKGFNTKISWKRVYLYDDLFKSILGSVGNIPKEDKEYYLGLGYSLNDIVGISNIEKQYEEILKGKKAIYKKISNNYLELVSEAEKGNDIVLNIDIDLIKEINDIVDRNLLRAKSESNTKYLSKTYVVIQEPNTGSILAITGRQILYNNGKYSFYDITPYALTDPMIPGSVVKGASMLVGYNTGVIKMGDSFTDECVKLYNIPRKCSSTQYGRLNDINALAYSSNVFQFKIAMKVAGINYYYNTKASVNEEVFNIYRNTFKSFGLGIKTGIDLPIESLGYSGSKIAPDLLLNFSIGQYDSYTPIQLSQYITTIASSGNRIRPRILKEIHENNKIRKMEPEVLNKIDTKEEYLKRIQEGFGAVMDYGYGKNVMGNAPIPAGKTGTSESFIDTNNDGKIDTLTTSNSFVGYSPRDNPIMTITVTSPDVEDPNTNISFRTYMNRRIAREVSNKFFEIYN